ETTSAHRVPVTRHLQSPGKGFAARPQVACEATRWLPRESLVVQRRPQLPPAVRGAILWCDGECEGRESSAAEDMRREQDERRGSSSGKDIAQTFGAPPAPAAAYETIHPLLRRQPA